ncbi:MAG TPA: DMT family transporter [Candidatus Dormibacteraeota bacterium]|nr:DMT family transporter [Candidatus Dormibacteraeota bacterium]
MGILIGLLTALTWGGADFAARFSTHRIGTLRTMFYMQFIGFLLLTISMRWLGGWGHLADGSGWQPWAWGFLAGLLNACGTLSLYRSFEIGKMAVVAPLSASYPALTLILSCLGGDHLPVVRVAGILFILFGVAVVAGGEHAPSENSYQTTKTNTRGIGWACVAAIAFGVLFWVLGIRIVPRVGAVQAVWMIRLTSSLLTAAIIFSAAQPIHLPHGGIRWMVLGVGGFDTLAFVLSNRGMQMEQVAVISVLGSLYGAVTVGLAAIFLRENISGWQWTGIATIFAGIFLISK